MKIAIISDVHSNLEALSEALSIIKENNVNAIFSCGDIVGYGPDPEECVNLFVNLGISSVKGNHDAGVSGDSIIFEFNSYAKQAIMYTKRVMSFASLNFLKSLPYRIVKENFTIFHGSLLPNHPFKYIVSSDDVIESFLELETPIGFYGHTHVPCVCELDKNGALKIYDANNKIYLNKESKYLINVGSVGQPRDGNPQGSFVIFDLDEYSVSFVRFNYDIEKVYDKIIKRGLPSYLGERLFMGF